MWFQSLGEPHIRQRGEKAPAGLGRNSPQRLDTGRGSVVRGVTCCTDSLLYGENAYYGVAPCGQNLVNSTVNTFGG